MIDIGTLRKNILTVCTGDVKGNVDNILGVAPHLDRFDAVELLSSCRKSGFAEFIGPPVAIRGAEHAYKLTEYAANIRLSWAAAVRLKESFVYVPAGWVQLDRLTPWLDKSQNVADYAEANYGGSLRSDRAAGYILYCFVGADPTVSVLAGIKSDHLLHTATEPRDADTPLLQQIEQALDIVAGDAITRAELRGLCPIRLCSVVCMYCGGAVNRGPLLRPDKYVCTCMYCGTVTEVQSSDVPGTAMFATPAPYAVRQASRIRFKHPPLAAVKMYYADWASRDFVPIAKSRRTNVRHISLTEGGG